MRYALNTFMVCVLALAYALVVSPARASAQVVLSSDFEDGTAQGWTSFNGASTPTNSTDVAESGTHSLLTSTNSSGASSGPSMNLSKVLLAGAKYTITGWVRLSSGETATNANFTIMRSDPSCSGGTCFDTVGPFQVAVTDSGWAQIGGSYSVSATETGLTLYSQLVGPTTQQSFYLDNVVITETAPPASGTPIATYTFADGVDGWTPFGSVSLASTVSPIADPIGNTHSLLTSGRTQTFEGPSLNLLNVNGVVAGATYNVTAYVLLANADSSNPTVTLSTKRTDCSDSSGIFNNLVTSGALSNTAWTQVQGTFSFSNLPGAPSSLDLYFQSSSATDSFYISNVAIGEIAPPPLPADQQDNTGITSTFEDGKLDGWASRAGATLTNTTAEAHDGTNSLLVTGRTANFDGPAISISNKMYVGSQYSISVWVKLLPTDGSIHNINMSLQTTFQGQTSFPGVNGFPGTQMAADGQWHQILVPNYTMASPYDPGTATLYLQTDPSGTQPNPDLVSFYIDDFQLTYIPPPAIQTDIPSIFERLGRFFPVGAEIDTSDISGPHLDLLLKHFDSIVSGNDMKWSSVENTKGTFTFGNADQEVGTAVCHNLKIRGHNLVWATGAQTPSYAFGDGTNSAANQAVVTANIQEHIQNEVQHFGNKVYVWDVVNEPLDPSQPDCLAHGPFYNVLGKSYIDVALQAARQYAPPGTQLFINDFNTDEAPRLACLIKVVKDLKNRGIPIDGVGHETHVHVDFPTVQAVADAIRAVHKAVPSLHQQVTEMDISVYNSNDNTSNFGANGGTVPPAIIAQQGWLYYNYFSAFRDLRGILDGVTFWGMADDNTWLDGFPINRLDLPLPFDTGLQAKPAYWGIINRPRELPGFGLNFHITAKTGPQNARVWTITADNPSSGTAYAVQINSFTIQQLRDLDWDNHGRGKDDKPCSPVVTSPSTFPVVLGDIAAGESASTTVRLNFGACHDDDASYGVVIPWSQANGADTGQLVRVESSNGIDRNQDRHDGWDGGGHR
jgi:endo-1,4-beta-xylanase